jgi:glycerol-3-phosphate dehydrogenase
MNTSATYDIFIIGGGINGAGVARDAAGRGLRAALCEQGDFAGATSSASTKLIHGGLRYLEYCEFRLVAEALAEREHLLAIAPHISRPLRFVMPHVKELRPRWMIRLGLWLYDHIGGRISLPHSHGVSLADTPFGAGLRPDLTRGFVYSDAWVDDARLVILNLRSAQRHGAEIFARTRMVGARREGEMWVCTLEDSETRTRREITARAIVNAAGPWVVDVESQLQTPDPSTNGKRRRAGVKLVRGSHIVVPSLFQGEHAYILQNDDRRIVFMIPYEGKYTLIGTTDVPQADMKNGAQISADEEDYLLRAVNRYLAQPVDRDAIVWCYAGVRPLFDDESDNPSAVTRDYTLMLDDTDEVPSLSVYGGKITTYRRLAESVLDKLAPWLRTTRGSWTREEALPGGEFACAQRDAELARLQASYPGLPAGWLTQVFQRHGLAAYELLGDAKNLDDLGRNFGGGLTEREVEHFVKHEWARAPEDILWRRTKCGLHMSDAQRAAFSEYFSSGFELVGQNK